MTTLKAFLRREVRPALGCTEPGAVALAVARACEELTDRESVAAIRVTVSGSIYKNGMAVGIPGAKGARGNALAAGLGALVGRSAYGLEVLRDTTDEDVRKAQCWVEDERVSVVCDPERTGVYVLAAVFTPTHKAVCLISGSHDRIVQVTLDGQRTFELPESPASPSGAASEEDLPETLEETLKLLDQMDQEDEDFLMEGVVMNRTMADVGLEGDVGAAGFGRALQDLLSSGDVCDDLPTRIRVACTAAADARMAGALLPVMSSAGSGNHGITAILPVAMTGEHLGKSRRDIARALGASHLATSFVKRRLGRLSPVCGCAVAAGAGAAAGITALLDGTPEVVSASMELLLANLAGMLCDGAKESCALKVGVGACEAFLSARFALEGRALSLPQGVVGASLEQTVENVARVNREGMKTVDRVIIDILDQRHAPAR